MKYLENFPLFRINQGLADYEIIKIFKFALPHECKQWVLINGFYSTIKSVNNPIEFCGSIEIVEEILRNKDDGTHLNK